MDRVDSDAEDDVKVVPEPPKVHYVSSEDERQRNKKSSKHRLDEMKKLREPVVEREFKSRWDSPTDEFERKR